VLLAGLGEFVAEPNVNILTMPAHSFLIANVLNGTADGFSYGTSNEFIAKFTAPEAYVLIVDDVSTNLNVAEGLLCPYGMQVQLCKSGVAALAAIAAQKYDLVLMDHMMPDMDGVETVKRIRALSTDDPYYEKVPIVALTANAVSGTREMFLENGFDDFLPKPIDTIKLDAILEKWIPKEKQQKTASGSGITALNPKQNADVNFAIEGIDVKKGMSISGGTIENYTRTLGVFQRDGIEKVEKLKRSLETDNIPLYVTYVHGFKSAAANIGADELSKMAEALEAAGNKKDLTFIQAHNANFLSTLETLLGSISEAIKTDKREEHHQSSVDMDLLKSELAKLVEAIDSVNFRAIEAAVESIQPFTHVAGIGGMVETVLQKTLVCEYDEATAMIRELLTR
jgi:CheY-like chemotaxis protein/HPt (histidine-containing phosphotransfer) domain-containing protein